MICLEVNKIQGWMEDHDLLWLYEKAQEMDSIAEIGCWKGLSTEYLLVGCKGTVYAIDHFEGTPNDLEQKPLTDKEDIYSIFKKNVGHYVNLKILKMNSCSASVKIPEVDMVFIDGNHDYEYVKNDIEMYLTKTKKLICGHDIKHPPVEKAVKEVFGSYKTNGGDIWYREI